MGPGMEFGHRGLSMHNHRDLVKFWRRATVKLANMATKVPKAKKSKTFYYRIGSLSYSNVGRLLTKFSILYIIYVAC